MREPREESIGQGWKQRWIALPRLSAAGPSAPSTASPAPATRDASPSASPTACAGRRWCRSPRRAACRRCRGATCSTALCIARPTVSIITTWSSRNVRRASPAKSCSQPDAHGVVADEPRAARMHADDLLVLRPRRHHRVDVLRLERLVERQRGVRRRRVDRRRADLGHGVELIRQGPRRGFATVVARAQRRARQIIHCVGRRDRACT